MTPEKLSNLRRVMERYGLRGKAAAEAVGVSPSMISRWMRGEKYLSAHSKSARPLAEYILSGKNALSTENRVWLKRRFEESDRNIRIDWTKAGRDEILTGLINYISNDDSFRCYREDPHAAVIRSADFFTAGGMEELVNLLRWELEELPAGSVVYLYVTGDGAEMDDDFHDELADAVSRGIELRIFILPETEPDSRVLERFDGEIYVHLPEESMDGTAFMSRYRDILFSPGVRAAVYYEKRLDPLIQTRVIIPDRIVMTVDSTGEGAPPGISAVRRCDFVNEAARRAENSFSGLQPIIEPGTVITSRFYYKKLFEALRRSCSEMEVLSDGLCPMFMSEDAFENYLFRKNMTGAERSWRLERFLEKKHVFEDQLRQGMNYREHNRSRFALPEGLGKLPSVFGDELFDEDSPDPKIIIDILDGYIRLLRTYSNFRVRFYASCTGPEREFMLIHSSYGFILKRTDGVSEQRVYSSEPLLMQSEITRFTGYWTDMRYRTLRPDGETDTIREIESLIDEICRRTGISREQGFYGCRR